MSNKLKSPIAIGCAAMILLALGMRTGLALTAETPPPGNTAYRFLPLDKQKPSGLDTSSKLAYPPVHTQQQTGKGLDKNNHLPLKPITGTAPKVSLGRYILNPLKDK